MFDWKHTLPPAPTAVIATLAMAWSAQALRFDGNGDGGVEPHGNDTTQPVRSAPTAVRFTATAPALAATPLAPVTANSTTWFGVRWAATPLPMRVSAMRV